MRRASSFLILALVPWAIYAQQPVLIRQGGNTANVTGAGALQVDGSAVTQPVSGTITANQGGTWTVQPGNTANTTPWLFTIQQGGNAASVTAGNALKVDGSAVTQPVSQSGNWTARIVGNAGGVLDFAGQNATSPANSVLTGCQFNTTPTTITSGNSSPIQCDSAGNALVNLKTAIPAGGNTIGAVTQASGPWTINMTQLGGTTVDTNSGTKSAGTLRVVLATDQPTPTNAFNVQGALSNNGAAATTNRVGTVPCIAQTAYRNGTASTQGRDEAADCGTDGLLWVATLPAIRPASYTASKNFAASSTTDNACLPGNASNTVLVTEIRVSGTQTTAGIVNVEFAKRSTAGSGGTSANMTVVPDDSNYAAGVSVPLSYTSTGPTVGTLVGDIDNQYIGFMAAATASPDDIGIVNLRQKPVVLRGTGEKVCVNLGGALTGGNMSVTFRWIETTTITP